MRHPFAALLIALLAFTSACGVSGSDTPNWDIVAVGPQGAVVKAGDVVLTVPPGAFSQQIAVGILPDQTQFPILAQDGCSHTYLGPIWCCGPVGTDLAVGGTVRIGYDESLIPAGFTEADLELLLWDNTAMVMRPQPGATHDTVANFFEFGPYNQLGHLAVGVRDCTGAGQNFAFAGVPQNPQQPIRAITAPGLGLSNTMPEGDPVQLMSGQIPNHFLPSASAGRVLYEATDSQNEGSVLRTVLLDGTSDVLVAGQDEILDGGDPNLGWLEARPGNIFFLEFLIQSQQEAVRQPQGITPGVDQSAVSYKNGDGSDSQSTGIHGIPGTPTSSRFFEDVRQSPNGQTLMLQWERFVFTGGNETPGDFVDVVDTLTGNVHSSEIVPRGGGLFTPRFTPDSAHLLGISPNALSVVRYDFDGGNPTVLFDIAQSPFYTSLLDALMMPGGLHMAVLARDEGEFSGDHLLLVEVATGSILDSYGFGFTRTYDELVLHPQGSPLYIDFGRAGVFPYELDPSVPDGVGITEHPQLYAPDLRYMDIHATTGDLLQVSPAFQQIDSPDFGNDTFLTQGPGVCVSDRFGGNAQHMSHLSDIDVRQARWIETIRRAPGMVRDLWR